jgi:MFS family permease
MQETAPENGQNSGRVMACAMIVTFMVALDSALLHVSFPAISGNFAAASTSTLAWVINVYSLTLAVLLSPSGRMADQWGSRRMLVTGFAISILGAVCCGLSLTAGQLVFSRFLQALGGAVALPASLAVILANFHGRERAVAVGKWSAAGGVAAAAGPPLAAAVMRLSSWRILFFFHVPLCLWGLWLSWKIPEDNRSQTKLPGIASAISPIAAGMGFLVAAITIRSLSKPALFGAAFAGMLLIFIGMRFVRKEKHLREVLADRGIAFACLATFCFGGAFGAMFISYDLALVNRFHFDIPSAALLLTPIPFLSVPVARRCGELHQRWHAGTIIMLGGMLLFSGALFFLLMLLTGRFNAFAWTATLALSGAAIGLCFPSVSLAGVQAVPANYYALASGLNQSCRHMGTVIGVALIALLSGPAARDFFAAWALFACFCIGTIFSAGVFSAAPGILRTAHD